MIDQRHRRTALLVAGCFFMENLDGTIVSTSAPRIAASLHTAPASVGLVVTAYLLTLAVLIPLSGWLAARLGARKVFLTAIVLFLLASAACASAADLGQLVAMRVLQGIGGAMMVPVGRLMVVSTSDKRDIPRLIAYVTWPGLAAPVIAPLVGGLLTTYASWRWMFLINLPLGVVAFVAAWRLIRGADAERRSAAEAPLDWAGMVLTSTGLGALTYAAHLVSVPGSGAWAESGMFAAAVVLLAAAVWRLLRARHPLIELRALRIRTFRSAIAGGAAHWTACGAVPFLLPLLFEQVYGWSAVTAGAVVLFVFVGNIGIKPATTYLMNRFGFRPLMVTATLGVAASLAAFAALPDGAPMAVAAAVALVSGAARSLGMTCYNTIAYADVPAERMRDANTMMATTQQVGTGLGVAAATVALRIGGGVGHPYPVACALIGCIALIAFAEAARLGRGEGAAVLSAQRG
ncbi:MFS transporter [Mangrovactinospora gilvigrisea]|uniref:MFS transporter n=1 Tax=Mangrovactinospora gilvigrisea TaxID=1428644 RepID=A0A1J7BAJ1_9ACTN|nr:MFS transporter [Mangrovactinospora gilvigrisea]OIV35711.1 MFS transporter [Mangrovactinospora gilvigrisea]